MGFVCGVSAAFFLLDVLTGVSAAFFTDLTLAGDFGSFFCGDLALFAFLPFVGDSGASMFARLRGDGARARVGRGVVIFVVRCACGRGASWVWGARCLKLGARRYRGTVGVDAGACGLGGSRRRWFLRSRFHLCDANIFGGARAARNGGARGTGVRGALLEAVGVADTAAHGLFWEPREVSCFFACAAGASRGAPGKARTAPRRVVCVHSRCDSFRRAILGALGHALSCFVGNRGASNVMSGGEFEASPGSLRDGSTPKRPMRGVDGSL